MTHKVIEREEILEGLELVFQIEKDRNEEVYDVYVILNEDETRVPITELSESSSWDWNGEKRTEVYYFMEQKGKKFDWLPSKVDRVIKEKLSKINNQVTELGVVGFYNSL